MDELVNELINLFGKSDVTEEDGDEILVSVKELTPLKFEEDIKALGFNRVSGLSWPVDFGEGAEYFTDNGEYGVCFNPAISIIYVTQL